jgi:hypothetical protein
VSDPEYGVLYPSGTEIKNLSLTQARWWVESDYDKGYIGYVVRYLPTGEIDERW